jgi:CheY-like chemotaxis protein
VESRKREADTSLKLLLVDDDPNDLVLFATAIEETGGLDISLRTAVDSHQAIDYLEGHGIYADRLHYPVPDLIVLDLAMSTRSGLDFLAWRKESGSYAALPVILFTGVQDRDKIEQALALGANFHLVKPHKFEDLKAIVWEIYQAGMISKPGNRLPVGKLSPQITSRRRAHRSGPNPPGHLQLELLKDPSFRNLSKDLPHPRALTSPDVFPLD